MEMWSILYGKHPCNLCCFKSAVGGYPDRCLHVKYGVVWIRYGGTGR
jgi:hypothetical protein